MKKNDCFYLGKITKLHGFKGELEAFLDVDQPEEYQNLEMFYVAMNPRTEMLVPYFIASLTTKKNNRLKVKLEDVDSHDLAESLVNKELYLPLEELPELEEDQFYFHEIVGFTVIDENEGHIGVVTHVIDQGANPLLAISHNDKEILVPIQDQFIDRVEKGKKEIHISTPEGFFELF